MEPTYYESEEQSVGDKIKNNIVELIEFVAIAAAILIVIRFFIAEPHKVSGSSMVPNFHDGDYIITNKLATTLSEPKRGEVIILHNPRNQDQVFIKRIVGLPSERISIVDSTVYINNQPLPEGYLPKGLKTPGEAFLSEGEEITIPAGQYFVVGDNRPGSSDSREWGTIPKDLIVGAAFLRYWPPQKFTLIRTGEPST